MPVVLEHLISFSTQVKEVRGYDRRMARSMGIECSVHGYWGLDHSCLRCRDRGLWSLLDNLYT